MRRNIGRHTDRNTARAVDQQVRETRGQYRRLCQHVVKGRHKIDGILIDIRQHFRGNLAHTALGVTISRRRVAVNGTKVTVTVYQHIAHREILCQPHHRVIDGGVAVGMIFTQHFTDGVSAFAVRLRGGDAVLIHTV